MKSFILSVAIPLLAMAQSAAYADVTFCCDADNDLYRAYTGGMGSAVRFGSVDEALEAATTGSAVLILADDYPAAQTTVPAHLFDRAAAKKLRLYVEFPADVPGLKLSAPRSARWERLIINSPIFSPALPPLSILDAHSCVFTPVETSTSLVSIGRVAGFDTAVYGIPPTATPALLQLPDHPWFIGTTGLSHFQRGRFAPTESWTSLWIGFLKQLDPATPAPRLVWQSTVRPSFAEDAGLSPAAYRDSLGRLANWYLRSGIMPDAAGEKAALALTADGIGTAPLSAISPGPDGLHGILEAFESAIQPDGSQNFLVPLRADCNAESAMALALASPFTSATAAPAVAENLLRYVYETSGMCGGERGDPKSPAYGLIAWGMGSDAWERANYGDDNARTILASLAASATLGIDRWNTQIVRAILANYRTTGRNGFRGDRIDMPELRANGWRHYFEGAAVNNSPHFEGYLWACYLWAYRATGYRPLLDRARAGISGMMAAYPAGWRRNDMLERGHMVLPLAWLVRVDDSAQARQWLYQICDDMLRTQQPCGALPERENGGAGHYQAPKSNEEYGTAETPLIQKTGDPATDQLYTTGFALIGLHEAAAATGDPRLKAAEDKLADYLVRIQTRSANPRLDGVWFRAFDYGRWDYWASSADLGWGAWVIESGWGQTWIAAAFALREHGTTLWDLTAKVKPGDGLPALLQEMDLEPGTKGTSVPAATP